MERRCKNCESFDPKKSVCRKGPPNYIVAALMDIAKTSPKGMTKEQILWGTVDGDNDWCGEFSDAYQASLRGNYNTNDLIASLIEKIDCYLLERCEANKILKEFFAEILKGVRNNETNTADKGTISESIGQ